METITFSAFSAAGTLIGSVNVSGIVVYGTDYYMIPLNQAEGLTVDGHSIVQGNVVSRGSGSLIIKGVSLSEGRTFRTWLSNTLQYKANFLGLNTDGVLIDLGKGANVPITFSHNARYAGKTTKQTSVLEIPGVFAIDFKYTFL